MYLHISSDFVRAIRAQIATNALHLRRGACLVASPGHVSNDAFQPCFPSAADSPVPSLADRTLSLGFFVPRQIDKLQTASFPTERRYISLFGPGILDQVVIFGRRFARPRRINSSALESVKKERWNREGERTHAKFTLAAYVRTCAAVHACT